MNRKISSMAEAHSLGFYEGYMSVSVEQILHMVLKGKEPDYIADCLEMSKYHVMPIYDSAKPHMKEGMTFEELSKYIFF